MTQISNALHISSICAITTANLAFIQQHVVLLCVAQKRCVDVSMDVSALMLLSQTKQNHYRLWLLDLFLTVLVVLFIFCADHMTSKTLLETPEPSVLNNSSGHD